MGKLTTHVLDTANGCPGAGIQVTLARVAGEDKETIVVATTNADGRCDQPLLDEDTFVAGTYELSFDVAAYFDNGETNEQSPPFLDVVTLRVTLADDAHYHVPLLVSPWSYSTYRGS